LVSSQLACTWKTMHTSQNTSTMELSKPVCWTFSTSSAMCTNAYFDTNPTKCLYKVMLKVWLTTCKIVSNDALISLCWSIMTLFTTSQHIQKSPILFCNIRLSFQWACSTLQNPNKSYNDNNNIITVTINNKTSYLFEVRFPKCIKLSIHAFTNFPLCGINHVLFTYSTNKGNGSQTLSKYLTQSSNKRTFVESMIFPHASIITSQAFVELTSITHFALTFLLMWNRHNKLWTLGNTMLIAFTKVGSLSQTITLGWSSVTNNPFNFCNA